MMITLQQAKQQLKTVLHNIYDARESNKISYMFLQHITGLSASEQLINSNQLLSTTQTSIFLDGLEKLQKNTPIQHIIGYVWFDNEQFIVNKEVLIPRPETEELLQWIKQEVHFANTIIDVGTGSGILAIALKKHFKSTHVHAVDVCNNALFIAKQNAVAKQIQINWHEVDFLDKSSWHLLPTCSVLVSNPPYIKQEEDVLMHSNVLQHEPHKALFVANNNALIFYEALAAFSNEKLEPNGKIFVEINENLGDETCKMFNNFGFETTLKKDLQEKNRMIKAWKK